jgi:hypothetical protein
MSSDHFSDHAQPPAGSTASAEFSDWAAAISAPIAVRLAGITARARADRVFGPPKTATEVGVAGFNLYRRERATLTKADLEARRQMLENAESAS